MKYKRIFFFLLLIVLSIISFNLALSYKESLNYKINPLNEEYFGGLRDTAKVECLKNSQCSAIQECFENRCIDKNKINLCSSMGLFNSYEHLKLGNSINDFRWVITETLWPNLLSDGLLVEIVNNNLTEHFYVQAIFIGDAKIEEENNNYFIKMGGDKEDFLYKYKIYFSNDVDFSSENIKGNVLKILGKEYIIGEGSTNSAIYLISEEKKTRLEDGNKAAIESNLIDGTLVRFLKGESGNIATIEISFTKLDSERIFGGEKYIDPLFNAIELSFNSVDNLGKVDIEIGGYCPLNAT